MLKTNIELASYTLVVEFVKAGFGIDFATKEYIKKEIEEEKLFIINIKEKIPTKYVDIAISKNYRPSFGTSKLLEIFKEN